MTAQIGKIPKTPKIPKIGKVGKAGKSGKSNDKTTSAEVDANSQLGKNIKEVNRLINEVVNQRKPIVALCMGPTTVAKALEGTGNKVSLTVGNLSK